LKDRVRCSLDQLKIGDRLILLQRYKDTFGVLHSFEVLGIVTNLSDFLYTNLFIHFSNHHNIDLCALRLKSTHQGKILQFKETNTYRTVNNILLDLDTLSEDAFTIQSIGSLHQEAFRTITISYPVYKLNRHIIHTLLPIGILVLIDQYLFDY
jgi:hypothetical protein